MSQELLLGGSSSSATSYAYSGAGERNKALISNNNNGGIITEGTTAAATENPSNKISIQNDGSNNSNPEQNLRCPRCDSSNTKFCYYNNYNLTQPRHFCKTCRRYWTKGGALRNVPIGGGCRKNKTSFTGKPKVYTSSADILLKSELLDPQESSLRHPIMWSSPPQLQNSHLLAFLRSTQSPTPNPSLSNHTYPISYSPLQSSNQAPVGFGTAMNLLNSETSLSGYEYPCSTFLRNKNQTQTQTLTQTQPQHLLVSQKQNEVAQPLGGVQQNSGIQELYQRMNLSANSNTNSYSSGRNDTNHAHVGLGTGHGVSVSSSPTSSRPGFQSAPVMTVGGGSNSGLWNLPTGDYSTWKNDHLPAATSGDGCLL